MLIEFSINNYRSFNDLQTLSLKSTGLVSEDRQVDDNNILEAGGYRILKIGGIYGANASGKSNIVRGLKFLKSLVTSSLESEGMLKNYMDHFKLGDSPTPGESFFQIVLLLEGKRYRYGFTVSKEKGFEKEWLYGPAEKNETFYFKRIGPDVDWNAERFGEASHIPLEKLRDDALFLSFVSSYDGAIAQSIRNFICDKILIDEGKNTNQGMYGNFLDGGGMLTKELIDKGKKEIVLEWMRKAGLHYTDLIINKFEVGKGNDIELVILFKNRFNNKGEVIGSIPMWLTDEESSGTRKYFEYIGNLYKIFSEGGLYICDEIDSNFHPALLQKIVASFQDTNMNRNGAQLLFTSHDTNLMDPRIMRRDQFYFTEKTSTDNTRVYSLADLKGVRNNADFAKHYLLGWYGAMPMLEGFLSEKKDGEAKEIPLQKSIKE